MSKAKTIHSPAIEEAFVNTECTLKDVRDLSGAGMPSMFIGQVQHISVGEEYAQRYIGSYKGETSMIDKIPNAEEMTALVGQSLYSIWNKLCALIDEHYDMDCLWNKGGKAWEYEYKYRRGGKTLCALYARENCVGFMIILGKDERSKFEADRNGYSKEVQRVYDEAQTYHDGKWLMFEPSDTTLFDDFIKLLKIKRKPNKK